MARSPRWRTCRSACYPGEATALVGHNGAGKTTLIKLLLGLIRPSAGSVRVLDVDPAGRQGAEARRALGFLPENVAFHGAMSGTELMKFYARLKGQPVSRNRDLLARVGLAEAADRRVSTYSKGMRQRLGLAQTLIGDPRLLLLDEPTSGLDPASRAEVFDMIDKLRADGATVLVSTHALAEVGERVDRVAVLHQGGLLRAGSLAELRRETGRCQTALAGAALHHGRRAEESAGRSAMRESRRGPSRTPGAGRRQDGRAAPAVGNAQCRGRGDDHPRSGGTLSPARGRQGGRQ
jgi:ABC-type multidrug transport system ATPase subunit